jgi:O-antigen/teichoic acid export membrane protein
MNDLIIKFLSAFSSKIVSAFSGLAVTLYITNNLSVEESGYFLFYVSIMFVISLVLRQGFDNLILRDFLDEHKAGSYNLTVIAISRVFYTTVFCILLYWIVRVSTFSYLYDKTFYFFVSDIISLTILPFCLLNLFGYIFQANSKFFVSSFSQTFAVNLFFLLFACIYDAFVSDCDIYDFFYIYFISTYFSFFISCYLLFKSFKFIRNKIKADELSNDILNSKHDFFYTSLCGLLIQWGTYTASVFYISSSEMAALSAANRFAFVISFILTIVNTVAIPIFVSCIKQGNYEKLVVVSRVFSLMLYIASIPLVAIFILYSKELMSLFGEHYISYYPILCVLMAGQLINVLTGSVAYLLNLSGNERIVRKISLFTALSTVVLSIPVIHNFGLYGTCILMFLSLSLQNVFLFIQVKSKIGFWLVPTLSLTKIRYFWKLVQKV